MSENLLHLETSPYLLQHKDNPVHWRPWGPAALKEAKERNVPVLLSVGYAACHWCHVMAHESFEDGTTAGAMNRLFVNIKVDREERPDVDAIYQAALAMLGEHGGWPLTIFLTPEGQPFWGGTYFPKRAGFGRPPFMAIMERVSEVFKTEPDVIKKNTTALHSGLSNMAMGTPDGALSLEVIDQAADKILGFIDCNNGGIGAAPKFPQTGMLGLLYQAFRRSGNEALRDAVILSLTRMSQGGIYDHLGGGYSRYAVDERWLVPHFEKMLYDNALIIDLLVLLWQDTGNPLFKARIAETVDWLLREMRAEGGAFAASLDADSEGEEGRFYVWRKSEIDQLLGNEADFFNSIYNVTPTGNWEGNTILNRLQDPELPGADDESRLAAARTILLGARASRIRPGWDDKVLADWNGLMIAALANAAATFGKDEWQIAAQEAYDFVTRDMGERAGDILRLRHSARAGRLQDSGMLDDHVMMMRAGLILYEVSGEIRYLEDAEALFRAVEHHFRAESGGYYFTADDADALIVRMRNGSDNATPAGNGILAQNLARLYLLTGNALYRERAEEVLGLFGTANIDQLVGLTSVADGFLTLEDACQITIIGDRGDPACAALLDAVFSAPVPRRVLTVISDTENLPEIHPAKGKAQTEGKPTAFVCRGPVCSLPVTDPEALTAQLRA